MCSKAQVLRLHQSDVLLAREALQGIKASLESRSFLRAACVRQSRPPKPQPWQSTFLRVLFCLVRGCMASLAHSKRRLRDRPVAWIASDPARRRRAWSCRGGDTATRQGMELLLVGACAEHSREASARIFFLSARLIFRCSCRDKVLVVTQQRGCTVCIEVLRDIKCASLFFSPSFISETCGKCSRASDSDV